MKKVIYSFCNMVLAAVINWAALSIILALIALCFDLSITLRQTTGIWLLMIAIRVFTSFAFGWLREKRD